MDEKYVAISAKDTKTADDIKDLESIALRRVTLESTLKSHTNASVSEPLQVNVPHAQIRTAFVFLTFCDVTHIL